MPGYTIDYLEFPSPNNGASREFFRKAFGWSFVSFGEKYDEIHGAGLLAGINGHAEDYSAATIAVVRTDNIEEAKRAVVAAGGVITREPYEYPGGRRFFFREPGGVELAVYKPNE